MPPNKHYAFAREVNMSAELQQQSIEIKCAITDNPRISSQRFEEISWFQNKDRKITSQNLQNPPENNTKWILICSQTYGSQLNKKKELCLMKWLSSLHSPIEELIQILTWLLSPHSPKKVIENACIIGMIKGIKFNLVQCSIAECIKILRLIVYHPVQFSTTYCTEVPPLIFYYL